MLSSREIDELLALLFINKGASFANDYTLFRVMGRLGNMYPGDISFALDAIVARGYVLRQYKNQVGHYELTSWGRQRLDAQHDTVVAYLKQQFPDWAGLIEHL